MELHEIEYKIACNKMNGAQVFTQMKQHIPSNWISVEDRLPELKQEIIIYYGLGREGKQGINYMTMLYVENIFNRFNPSHWMPLESPKQ